MKFEWITCSLDSVMNYFVKDFHLDKGEEIVSFEYFIDVGKQKVAFKLMIGQKGVK